MTCVWCNTIIGGADSDWQCHWCGWLAIEVILKLCSNQQAIQTDYQSHHLSYVRWWFIIASTALPKQSLKIHPKLLYRFVSSNSSPRLPWQNAGQKSENTPWEASAFTSKFSFFSSLLLPSARRTDQRFASALTNHLSFDQQMLAPFMSYSQNVEHKVFWISQFIFEVSNPKPEKKINSFMLPRLPYVPGL